MRDHSVEFAVVSNKKFINSQFIYVPIDFSFKFGQNITRYVSVTNKKATSYIHMLTNPFELF